MRSGNRPQYKPELEEVHDFLGKHEWRHANGYYARCRVCGKKRPLHLDTVYMSQAYKSAVAKSMAAPLKVNLNYASIAKTLLKTEKI